MGTAGQLRYFAIYNKDAKSCGTMYNSKYPRHCGIFIFHQNPDFENINKDVIMNIQPVPGYNYFITNSDYQKIFLEIQFDKIINCCL